MEFLGYELTGHMIAASSPATESIENIRGCAENGAAAVILKSASSTRLGDENTRRCHFDEAGFWAESGFDREIMPLQIAAEMVQQARRETAVPIIASVTELTLAPELWIRSCDMLSSAGASALQLDFFYLPNLLLENDFNDRFTNLLLALRSRYRIPIMPKLNIGLPVELATALLKKAGITYVSLLDSIRSPTPDGADLTGKSLSLFGSFMFPITRQYTSVMSNAGFRVCAGGGVTNARQAAELIRLGADTVQFATEVLLNGFTRFREIEREITKQLPVRGNIPELCKRKAIRINSTCTSCGKCQKQTFCTVAKDLSNSFVRCEGCGFCASLCESGAIQMGEV
jgi:dihydroorotate dehydrogenase/Pyruvate/2-oxoacid:ferredoxin oxidoreductase delta subunit